VIGEVPVDRGLEIDKETEHAPLQAAARGLGKETLNRIEPGRRGGGEVEGPPPMARRPSPDLGVRVAAIVVEDHVDQLVGWDVTLEAVEKAQEFLVSVWRYFCGLLRSASTASLGT
jgi:hypothetical protein